MAVAVRIEERRSGGYLFDEITSAATAVRLHEIQVGLSGNIRELHIRTPPRLFLSDRGRGDRGRAPGASLQRRGRDEPQRGAGEQTPRFAEKCTARNDLLTFHRPGERSYFGAVSGDALADEAVLGGAAFAGELVFAGGVALASSAIPFWARTLCLSSFRATRYSSREGLIWPSSR